MVDTFVYYADLPNSVKEMVLPCYGGFTIYINCRLSQESQYKALIHAFNHITNNDFEKSNVNQIESEAHNDCKMSEMRLEDQH